MSAALAPIARKLGRLIRMLSSPIDGEVIGAARAMMRVLAAQGATLHDLADVVEQPAAKIVSTKPTRPAKPKAPKASRPPRHRGRRAPTWDDLATDYRLRWIDAALLTGAMTAWECDFTADVRRLIAADKRRAVSPRQRRILDTIIAEAWRAGAQP